MIERGQDILLKLLLNASIRRCWGLRGALGVKQMIESDIRSQLKYSKSNRFSNNESTAWVEIFVSYWKAIGTILKAEEAQNQGRIWSDLVVEVCDAWKEVTNNIIKYNQSGALPSWSIVCMHSAAKYLRVFAIKADDLTEGV